MRKTNEIIKKFRKERKMSVAELADKVGCSQVFITKIENEQKRVSEKILENLKLILSKKEIEEIIEYETYIDTPDSIKQKLERMEKQLEKNIGSVIPDKFKSIPLFSSVSAGCGMIPDAEPIDYISIPGISGDEVAIIVKGDSMEPTIYEGDYIVVKRDLEVSIGDIGVFFLNTEYGEGVVKRLKYKNGKYVLESDNNAYDDIEIKSEDVKVCGKVVKVIKNNLKKIQTPSLVKEIENLPPEQRRIVEAMIAGLKIIK
ncbi:MAG: XRE family transcriptional regulator [Cetobacterium sp.]